MRLVLFIVSVLVALSARQAWADVRTTSSCSKTTAETAELAKPSGVTGNAEKMCSFDIMIEGQITSSTVDLVKKAIAERDQMMKREGGWSDWWSIHIDSPGGSVNAAIEIGKLLRSMDAPIEVNDDEVCASACVLVLAGATHRFLNGRVGIHRPYLEATATNLNVEQVQKAYSGMTEKIRSYLRGMNVSDRLADDMMIVPPEKVRFLSSDELVNYGLGFIDPVTKEASDLKEARKLGIDRGEYIRRKAQSQTLCKLADPNEAAIHSLACINAVLAGKHVERAPPCRNMAATGQPWEREWGERKQPSVDDVVTDNGFLISGTK